MKIQELPDHHDGYIRFEQFEKNKQTLARNAYAKLSDSAKSSRGGSALFAGLLRCRRCGRLLQVQYGRPGFGETRYVCRRGNRGNGTPICISFSGARCESVMARELLAVVQPVAIEAAAMARQQLNEQEDAQRRALALQREQAEYEVRLAARRYEAVDPDNRLVAAELEARWNAAMEHLRNCEAQCADFVPASTEQIAILPDLAANLSEAWHAPTTDLTCAASSD